VCTALPLYVFSEARSFVVAKIEELVREIKGLPKQEAKELFALLATEIEEFAVSLWDVEIAKDDESGSLDRLVKEALQEHRAGKTRPL
jgi:hypothetical protein